MYMWAFLLDSSFDLAVSMDCDARALSVNVHFAEYEAIVLFYHFLSDIVHFDPCPTSL